MAVATQRVSVRRLRAVRDAAMASAYVSLGNRATRSVHEFYRYPARFSPEFARSVIKAFSEPGELVVDPFMGGGTTLVEARLSGRLSIGSDINELASFVTRAKTSVVSTVSLRQAELWRSRLRQRLSNTRAATWAPEWEEDGYLDHLHDPETWRIRNLIAQALVELEALRDPKANRLVRCAVLRTGQWALDMRDLVPSASDFRWQLDTALDQMIKAAGEFSRSVSRADRQLSSEGLRRTVVLSHGLPGLAVDPLFEEYAPPSLVLTSPPYPGVYVNYHRWKVRGRKETAAPFWVANCLDGHGLSHYTMSARVGRDLDKYFDRVGEAWADLAALTDPSTWVVQMIGFHNPRTDLPRYLGAMSEAGFREVRFSTLATAEDGRLWRRVPGRRWWVVTNTRKSSAPHTAREVVLVHRLRD